MPVDGSDGIQVSAVRLCPRPVNEVPKLPPVAVQPRQRLFRVLGRRPVFHGRKFFRDAHAGLPAPRSHPKWFAPLRGPLRDRMPVIRGIPSRRMMLELPLNVIQQSARPKRKSSAFSQDRPKLFFHQRQPFGRLLRGANSPGRFEPNRHASLLRVFADRACHYKAHRQRRIRRLLSRWMS